MQDAAQVPSAGRGRNLDATLRAAVVCSSWQQASTLHSVQRHHCGPAVILTWLALCYMTQCGMVQ